MSDAKVIISQEAKEWIAETLALIATIALAIEGEECHDDINFKAKDIQNRVEELVQDLGIDLKTWNEATTRIY